MSARSASLQMTTSWVVWLTHQKDRIPSRGNWTSSRSQPLWTSWGSTMPSAGSCTRVRATPSINRGWGMEGLRAALPRRTWGYWWMKSLTWDKNAHSQPRRPAVSWLHQKKGGQQVEWGNSAPLLYSHETPPGALHLALEPSGQERHRSVGGVSREGPHKSSEGWNTSPVREGWENQGCSAWRREVSGRTYCVLSVLKGGL